MSDYKKQLMQLDDDIEDLVYIDGEPFVVRRATETDLANNENDIQNAKDNSLVDLTENAMYVIHNSQITKVTPKAYGTDEVIWKDGKVHDVIRSQRERLNGQEVI